MPISFAGSHLSKNAFHSIPHALFIVVVAVCACAYAGRNCGPPLGRSKVSSLRFAGQEKSKNERKSFHAWIGLKALNRLDGWVEAQGRTLQT